MRRQPDFKFTVALDLTRNTETAIDSNGRELQRPLDQGDWAQTKPANFDRRRPLRW